MSDCTVRPRLLPCPFCGSEAEIVSLHPHEETPVGICCSRCPAIFADGTTYSGFKEYDTEAEAIAAWNIRAERTCKLEHVKSGVMYDVWRYTCCGYEHAESVSDESVLQNYCPNCGAKVVEQ